MRFGRRRLGVSVRTFLPVAAIAGDALRLSDGGLRAVLECPTLAFGIKGEAEQRAVIDGWTALLNSLSYPLEILVRSLPQRSGTLHVSALDGTVTIHRDENGFVNIYASTPHDLFLAQGYVHASERMWQMEIFRRIGAGRLAELFGASQIDTDRLVRTLDWRRAAERDVATSPPDLYFSRNWASPAVSHSSMIRISGGIQVEMAKASRIIIPAE